MSPQSFPDLLNCLQRLVVVISTRLHFQGLEDRLLNNLATGKLPLDLGSTASDFFGIGAINCIGQDCQKLLKIACRSCSKILVTDLLFPLRKWSKLTEDSFQFLLKSSYQINNAVCRIIFDTGTFHRTCRLLQITGPDIGRAPFETVGKAKKSLTVISFLSQPDSLRRILIIVENPIRISRKVGQSKPVDRSTAVTSIPES